MNDRPTDWLTRSMYVFVCIYIYEVCQAQIPAWSSCHCHGCGLELQQSSVIYRCVFYFEFVSFSLSHHFFFNSIRVLPDFFLLDNFMRYFSFSVRAHKTSKYRFILVFMRYINTNTHSNHNNSHSQKANNLLIIVSGAFFYIYLFFIFLYALYIQGVSTPANRTFIYP